MPQTRDLTKSGLDVFYKNTGEKILMGDSFSEKYIYVEFVDKFDAFL